MVSKTRKRTDDVSQKCQQLLLDALREVFNIAREKREKKLIYIHMLSRVELEHRNSNTFSSEKQGKRKSG